MDKGVALVFGLIAALLVTSGAIVLQKKLDAIDDEYKSLGA